MSNETNADGNPAVRSTDRLDATKYKYGTLTADFLAVLPDAPLSLGESLCGSSKVARRIRALCAAYGPISQGALREASHIKYTKASNAEVSRATSAETKDNTGSVRR